MTPQYGLIIAVGTMVLIIFTVALSIILVCPSQLDDRHHSSIRPDRGLPPRRRRTKGYRHRRYSELTPLLDDHDQAATIPFASQSGLENQTRLDDEVNVAAPNNQITSEAEPAENNIKRYQTISSPLLRPENEYMLDRISEEGSSIGQPVYQETPGSQSSTHLGQEQHDQGIERLKSHRRYNDVLEGFAAAGLQRETSSSSSRSSSSSSTSSHVLRKGNEARSDRLAGHSVGGHECHCAFCLARMQAA